MVSSPFAVQHAAYDLVTQGYLTIMCSSVLQEKGAEEAQGRSGESEVKGTCDPVPRQNQGKRLQDASVKMYVCVSKQIGQ